MSLDRGLCLPERAVHVFFLRELAKVKAPGKRAVSCLGDLKTFQVVKEYVQPATSGSKTNYIDCLVQGRLGKFAPAWCPGGSLAGLPDAPRAVGPSTYFVSHAWSYPFSELVSLVERHYAGLPDTEGGKAYAAVYYWVDILAVTQHFSGNFTDHPDSDFPGVIRASKAVLFTMYPWRAPTAPTRVWCLFEALTAVQSTGVALDVLLDTGGSRDTGAATMLTVAGALDVRAAQASVPSDKAYIMGCIQDGVGVDAFNAILRRRLKEALLSTSLKKAVAGRDSDASVALLKAGGGRGADDTLDLPRWLPYGSTDHLVAVLEGIASASAAASGAPPPPRKLVLAGREAGQDNTHQDKTTSTMAGRYGAPIYTYLPLQGRALAAVARLLRRLEGGGGGGSEIGGGDGEAAGGGRVSVSRAGRRAPPGSAPPPPPVVPAAVATGATSAATAATPTRRGTRAGVGGGGVSGPSGAVDDALKRGDGGGGDGGSGGVGGGGGGGLRELWLRPGQVHPPVSYRPAWACKDFMSEKERRMAESMDANWKKVTARNKGLDYAEWSKVFYEHRPTWQSESELAKLQAEAEARRGRSGRRGSGRSWWRAGSCGLRWVPPGAA